MASPSLTLSYCLSAGLDLAAFCTTCRESRLLDLLALIVRFGEEETVEAVWRTGFRCSRCHELAKSLTVAVSAPSYRKVLELE